MQRIVFSPSCITSTIINNLQTVLSMVLASRLNRLQLQFQLLNQNRSSFLCLKFFPMMDYLSQSYLMEHNTTIHSFLHASLRYFSLSDLGTSFGKEQKSQENQKYQNTKSTNINKLYSPKTAYLKQKPTRTIATHFESYIKFFSA